MVQTCYKLLTDGLDVKFLNDCLNTGKYIFRYVLNEFKKQNQKIYKIIWNDYVCLAVNSSFPGETQFEQHESFNDVDLYITWSYNR